MKKYNLNNLLTSLAILFVFTVGAQNKIAVKQVKLNGANCIYFNENDNKAILNYGIIDNLNKIDSAALLKFMINITEEYPSYHIPTSEELSVLNNDTYVIPAILTKRMCPKTIRCDAISYNDIGRRCGLEMWATSLWSGNKNHPHICNNCKKWSAEFRKKEGCRICYDYITTFCKKIIICPACDGKGYTISKTGAETLSLVEFIKSNSPTVFNYSYYSNTLYFNSPTDFGIYNLKENSKTKIGSYISGKDSYNNEQNKISFILMEGGKTTKKVISEYYNNIKLHDEKLVSDIKKNINDKQIENAAFLYGDIINVSNYNELKITIYDSLKEKYKNEIVKLSDWEVESFIKKYSNDLINIIDGKHIIKVDNIGNILLDGILKNNNMYIVSPRKSFGQNKNYYDFQIPLNAEAEILITSNTTEIKDAVIRRQTFDGCKITENILGKPYRKSFINSSWFIYNIGYYKSEKNESLSKKDLVYVKKSNVNKYANSLLINTSEIDIVQKQEKLHNRIPKVIWRSTILTFGAFWIGLRSYEFSKIN
jgi:hypothetical protein